MVKFDVKGFHLMKRDRLWWFFVSSSCPKKKIDHAFGSFVVLGFFVNFNQCFCYLNVINKFIKVSKIFLSCLHVKSWLKIVFIPEVETQLFGSFVGHLRWPKTDKQVTRHLLFQTTCRLLWFFFFKRDQQYVVHPLLVYIEAQVHEP